MPMNDKRVRQYLKSYDFDTLFREELGWNQYRTPLSVAVEGHSFTLTPVAERNGMVTLQCGPQADGNIPEYRLRRRIEQEVTKSVQEHVIVFTDAVQTTQVWQWVKREAGKPAAYREHALDTRHQSGAALIQKLRHIAYDLEDEETLTLTIVGAGARKAFDVEKVTKKFYELFKKQHEDFHKQIKGIDLPDDQAWYTSVMLNRLMFVYFIQKKRFLDNDEEYLRNRLRRVQAKKGAGHFHSFYRLFLLRLFHEGLGQKAGDRTPEINAELQALLGHVPYLNGGIFALHSLEERYPAIEIDDSAFERIFDFFDQYQWHLDERPLRDDREINPDVLGYIFEKYINQKEMGAYYTREDITEYNGRNTIIPYLFDAAQPECVIAFREDGSVWRPLRENPDRYIFAAVKKGVDLPLPANIEAGVIDVAQRGDWNRPAPEAYALPTEIWREVVARRQRYVDIRAKLAGGEIHSINDFITYNLDIRQFAQDVIEQCEGPETLRAFWKALQFMRVLDPTVGSGAFLFAALNILEPLYEAVLERMESFVADADRADPALAGTKFTDFRQVLERIDKHPSRKYFIYKTIIVNNLFGVDIMEEATEICKLRLFLKLVAQVESVNDLEPLPDIDFNIRAGNTLVGYAQIDDIERLWTATGRLAFERDRDKLEMMARAYADLLHDFRDQQLDLPTPKIVTKKDVERASNEELRPELDKDLWRLYRTAGKVSDIMTLAQFRAVHCPLHWFVEFPAVMASGGFSVIVGNPPYVEYTKKDAKTHKSVKDEYQLVNYETEPCGDLYAFVLEGAYRLMQHRGRIGVIVPISIFGTDGFAPLQQVTLRCLESAWVSSYANRPSQLFAGAQKRLTILIGMRGVQQRNTEVHTAGYTRWMQDEFDALFDARIIYTTRTKRFCVFPASLEKIGTDAEKSTFFKLLAGGNTLGHAVRPGSSHKVYYTRKFGYFLGFYDFIPHIQELSTGRTVPPSELKELAFSSVDAAYAATAVLTSTTFFWFWNILSDCRNLNRRDLLAFPFDPGEVPTSMLMDIANLGRKYTKNLRTTSRTMTKSGLLLETFAYAESKPIIDEIDETLAGYYGFTDEERDSIINYDIKYRLRRGDLEESDE